MTITVGPIAVFKRPITVFLETDFSEDPNIITNSKSTKSCTEDIFRKPVIPNIPLKQLDKRPLNKNVADKNLILFQNLIKPNENELLPTRKSGTNSSVPVRRKFPGPAGLLPDKPPQSFNSCPPELEEPQTNNTNKENEIICSQTSELAFLEPPFKKLRQDFDMANAHSPLHTFTVEWVKKKAFQKGFRGRRIPFLALLLLSVDCSSADPVLTLRDLTGEIHGVLHRDVWKEMGEQIRPGAALVIKEVGVLSTGVSRRQVMVNITKNNLVTIYCPEEESGVIVNNVQPTTPADVLRSVNEWQAKAASPAPAPASRSRVASPSSSRLPNLFPNFPSTPPAHREFYNRVESKITAKSDSESSLHSDFDLFCEDINFDENVPVTNLQFALDDSPVVNKKLARIEEGNKIVLSQAETSMLDEVLSGVDLDDFDQI